MFLSRHCVTTQLYGAFYFECLLHLWRLMSLDSCRFVVISNIIHLWIFYEDGVTSEKDSTVFMFTLFSFFSEF